MKHVRSSSLLAGTSSFGEFSMFYLKDVKLYDNINKISSIIIPPEKIVDIKTDFNHIYTLSNSEKYVHHYCNCYIMCNVKEKGDKHFKVEKYYFRLEKIKTFHNKRCIMFTPKMHQILNLYKVQVFAINDNGDIFKIELDENKKPIVVYDKLKIVYVPKVETFEREKCVEAVNEVSEDNFSVDTYNKKEVQIDDKRDDVFIQDDPRAPTVIVVQTEMDCIGKGYAINHFCKEVERIYNIDEKYVYRKVYAALRNSHELNKAVMINIYGEKIYIGWRQMMERADVYEDVYGKKLKEKYDGKYDGKYDSQKFGKVSVWYHRHRKSNFSNVNWEKHINKWTEDELHYFESLLFS